MSVWQIILTSSLIAGIVSSIFSYFFSIRLRKLDFKNSYYKEIIKRRLDAYNEVDFFISYLKAVVVDEKNGHAYHQILGRDEDTFINAQDILQKSVLKSIWIDDKTNEKLSEVNYLFYNIILEINGKSQKEIIEIGKSHYQEISDLRFDLENCLKDGLNDLHDLKQLFKKKKANESRSFEIMK